MKQQGKLSKTELGEEGKFTAVTVGVHNPHKVGLVSNDGSYGGMLSDVDFPSAHPFFFPLRSVPEIIVSDG